MMVSFGIEIELDDHLGVALRIVLDALQFTALEFLEPDVVELDPMGVKVVESPAGGKLSAQQAVFDDEILAAYEPCEHAPLVGRSCGGKGRFGAVENELFSPPITAREPHHKVGFSLLGDSSPGARNVAGTAGQHFEMQSALDGA